MMLKFEMTVDDANLVTGALGKQPYEQVAALIQSLRDQARPQLEPPDPPVPLPSATRPAKKRASSFKTE